MGLVDFCKKIDIEKQETEFPVVLHCLLKFLFDITGELPTVSQAGESIVITEKIELPKMLLLLEMLFPGNIANVAQKCDLGVESFSGKGEGQDIEQASAGCRQWQLLFSPGDKKNGKMSRQLVLRIKMGILLFVVDEDNGVF